MPNRAAPPLPLRDGDAEELHRLTRSSSTKSGVAQRARIVLLAAEGATNTAIAERVGTTRSTVIGWRNRYLEAGIAGLEDQDRAGRPRQIDQAEIVAATLLPPPPTLDVTHWTSRLLARQLQIGHATVARAWKDYGLQPWRSETFKFATDPELVARVTDVVGLYLAPPHTAILLRVDARPQRQPLDQTVPPQPVQSGFPEPRTQDSTGYDAPTLFAALDMATGHRTSAVSPRQHGSEFLAFLRQIDSTFPQQPLSLVVDRASTHESPEIRAWLDAHPQIAVHVTPTSDSWLKLAEVWFGIIERRAAHRDTVTSVNDLSAKIRAVITGWDDRCRPFIWTAAGDDRLPDANRAITSQTRRYAKTAGRRREILEAGVDVFSSSGFRNGSIREIAERVGISQAGVLHHFANKNDLLAAVLEFRDDGDRTRLNAGVDLGIDKLRRLADLAAYNASVPGLVQLHCVLSAEATAPEHPAHQYFKDRYTWVVQYTTGSFEAIKAHGQLIDGVEPASAARALVALMDGLQVQWLLNPNGLDMREEIRNALRPLLTIEL